MLAQSGNIFTVKNKDIVKNKEILEDIFSNTWDGKDGVDVFADLCDFSMEIVNKIKADVPVYNIVVFMARKAWCFFKVLLRHLGLTDAEYERVLQRITHDGMMAIAVDACLKRYKAEGHDMKPSDLRIAVVDDTCVMGTSLTRCIRRLVQCFDVKAEKITLHAFAVLKTEWLLDYALPESNHGVADSDFKIRRNEHVSYNSTKDKDFHIVKWCGRAHSFIDMKDRDRIHTLSRRFVEAIMASSVPYTAFTPAFELSYSKAKEVFGDIDYRDQSVGGRLTQEKLNKRFSDDGKYDFYNITSLPLSQNSIEAFVLFPKNIDSELGEDVRQWLPRLPEAGHYMEPLIRVYTNKRLDKVLVVPFVHVPSASTGKFRSLYECMPDCVQPLVSDAIGSDAYYENQPKHDVEVEDLVHEGALLAYRLLGYTTSYFLGKTFLEKTCGLSQHDYKHEKEPLGMATLPVVSWVKENPDAVRDTLQKVWEHLEINVAHPTPCIVVDKHQESNTIFEIKFNNVFYQEFSKYKSKVAESRVEYLSHYSMTADFFRILIDGNEVARNYNAKMLLDETCRDMYDKKKERVFTGIAVKTFMEKLYSWMDTFDTTDHSNRVAAIITKLCDAGDASLYASAETYKDGSSFIGASLSGGEQSCFAAYNAEPSYAFCLQVLRDAICIEFDDKERTRAKAIHAADINIVKQAVKNLKNDVKIMHRSADFRPVVSYENMCTPLDKLEALLGEDDMTKALKEKFFVFNLPKKEVFDGKLTQYYDLFSRATEKCFDFVKYAKQREEGKLKVH